MMRGLRQLRRSPAHVAAVILSLGVGMAVCVAVFSIYNALLFTAVPGVVDRTSLIRVDWSSGRGFLSRDQLDAMTPRLATTFTSMAAEGDHTVALGLPAGPASTPAAFVSGRFFDTLGTTALAGRLLGPADDLAGAPPVMVIGESLSRQAISVGDSVSVGGRPFTIVGIVPAGFPGLARSDLGRGDADLPQIWLPLHHAASWIDTASPRLLWLSIAGRITPGTSSSAVRAQVAVVGAQLNDSLPRANATGPGSASIDRGILRAYRAGLDWRDSPRDALLTSGLVLFVPLGILAIACANVINLQLARASERARELSVRLALGASRARLVRLLGAEIVVLSAIAGGLGWLGATVVLKRAQALLAMPLAIDHRVFAFVLCLVVGVIALAGLVPAWLATRTVVAAGLRELHDGGVPHARLRATLVILQVSASCVLLFITGLSLRTLQAHSPPLPPDATHRLVADFNLSSVRPAWMPPRAGLFARAVLDRLDRDPAIRAAGFASFFGSGPAIRYSLPNEGDGRVAAHVAYGGSATPGWFDASGARLLAGRIFERVGGDTHTPDSATDVVVNEALAAALAGSATEALGRSFRIQLREDGSASTSGATRSAEVVGVIANTVADANGRPLPMLVLPMSSSAPPWLSLTVLANNNDDATRAIRSAVAAADAAVPWVPIQTMDARVDAMFAETRGMIWFGGALGLLALVLAAAGLYAVMAYTVRRRTREIGIRIAIGASPAGVVWRVLRQGVGLVTAGTLGGLAIAAPIARLMQSIFTGVSPADPRLLLVALAVLLVVALAASALPAYRAVSIDPMSALRDD